jgi:hypothetical protein
MRRFLATRCSTLMGFAPTFLLGCTCLLFDDFNGVLTHALTFAIPRAFTTNFRSTSDLEEVAFAKKVEIV